MDICNLAVELIIPADQYLTPEDFPPDYPPRQAENITPDRLGPEAARVSLAL